MGIGATDFICLLDAQVDVRSHPLATCRFRSGALTGRIAGHEWSIRSGRIRDGAATGGFGKMIWLNESVREWLSPEQRAQFDAKRYFDVIGCDSRKRYRIHYGDTTNVHEIGDDDLPSVGWCFRPEGQLVASDVMLAQKIALDTYEYSALAVANGFAIRFSRRAIR